MFICPTMALANEDDLSYKVVDPSEVPQGVQPVVVSSEEESNQKAKELFSSIVIKNNELDTRDKDSLSSIQPRNYNVNIDDEFIKSEEAKYDILGLYLNLKTKVQIRAFFRGDYYQGTLLKVYDTSCYITGKTTGVQVVSSNARTEKTEKGFISYGEITIGYYTIEQISGRIRWYESTKELQNQVDLSHYIPN